MILIGLFINSARWLSLVYVLVLFLKHASMQVRLEGVIRSLLEGFFSRHLVIDLSSIKNPSNKLLNSERVKSSKSNFFLYTRKGKWQPCFKCCQLSVFFKHGAILATVTEVFSHLLQMLEGFLLHRLHNIFCE